MKLSVIVIGQERVIRRLPPRRTVGEQELSNPKDHFVKDPVGERPHEDSHLQKQ
jgi:hypothetical protein